MTARVDKQTDKEAVDCTKGNLGVRIIWTINVCVINPSTNQPVSI
jgi:hypothetical protein